MDNIAAIATPPGRGGIGIVRISGPDAKSLLSRVFLPQSARFANFIPWQMVHGVVMDQNGEALDDGLGVFMPGPHSFTGEDVAEIHCHGNPVILEALLDHLFLIGARSAERGEFTKRAFLNGRLDLSQAEAVAELISAPTRKALRMNFDKLEGALSQKIRKLAEDVKKARQLLTVCLDFPEDEVEVDLKALPVLIASIQENIGRLLTHSSTHRLYQEGARAALVGPVNAGKSSLFNALAGLNRALVSQVPGTTRDYLELNLKISDMPLILVDTAGLRENPEELEALGISNTLAQIDEADLLIQVCDCSRPPDKSGDSVSTLLMESRIPVIQVWNKIDLAEPPAFEKMELEVPKFAVSCLTGENIDKLAEAIPEIILSQLDKTSLEREFVGPNQRQAERLRRAETELENMRAGFVNNVPLDCLATHLDAASKYLEDVLGLQTDEEVLREVFSTFCIGK